MVRVNSQCPKCGGEMIQGFIMDNTHGGRMVSHWAEGEPHKSFWMGIKQPEAKMLPVGTFRCKSCGFLEEYARDEFAAE